MFVLLWVPVSIKSPIFFILNRSTQFRFFKNLSLRPEKKFYGFSLKLQIKIHKTHLGSMRCHKHIVIFYVPCHLWQYLYIFILFNHDYKDFNTFMMKKYGSTGSPCLHPLCTSSCSERKLCKIDALNLVFKILIHTIIYSPKPKNPRTLYKKKTMK